MARSAAREALVDFVPDPDRVTRGDGRDCEVSHLAAGARFALAVEMERDVRVDERLLEGRRPVLPQVAQQIEHRGRPYDLRAAQRQAADRPDGLLRVARRASLEGYVVRVVDARRELVDEEPGVLFRRQEELDREHADEVELLGDVERELLRDIVDAAIAPTR